MKKHWKKISWKIKKTSNQKFPESKLLKLNSNKAKNKLKWKSVLSIKESVRMITSWYKFYYSKLRSRSIYEISLNQIKEYERILKKR